MEAHRRGVELDAATLCSFGPMKVTYALVVLAQAIVTMDRDGDGRLWGYALSKESGIRSGVLYPQLDRMLGEGWLVDDWEDPAETDRNRPPRRYYRLTDSGREHLGAILRNARRERRFGAVNLGWA